MIRSGQGATRRSGASLASGVAAGASLHEKPWFVVRGAADYCSAQTKNDRWHHYSAWVAAAYTRALLGHCHPFGRLAPASRSTPKGDGLKAIVDTLYEIIALRNDNQRRAIIAGLPPSIVVQDSAHGRLHIIEMVRACADRVGGRDALLDVLELSLGSDSDDFRRVRDTFDVHW